MAKVIWTNPLISHGCWDIRPQRFWDDELDLLMVMTWRHRSQDRSVASYRWSTEIILLSRMVAEIGQAIIVLYVKGLAIKTAVEFSGSRFFFSGEIGHFNIQRTPKSRKASFELANNRHNRSMGFVLRTFPLKVHIGLHLHGKKLRQNRGMDHRMLSRQRTQSYVPITTAIKYPTYNL